ncbi:MAG: hypothetical protein H6732_15395 [Alphaproteobacteria bacterium]|nr:hypothetical protein [Alphaproteobacteria bacterium]
MLTTLGLLLVVQTAEAGAPCALGTRHRILGDELLQWEDDGVTDAADRGTRVRSFVATVESGKARITVTFDSPYKPRSPIPRDQISVRFVDASGDGATAWVLEDVMVGNGNAKRLVVPLAIDAEGGARMSQRGVAGVELRSGDQRWVIGIWKHASRLLEDVGACAEMRVARPPAPEALRVPEPVADSPTEP